jgi:hypothetical protein
LLKVHSFVRGLEDRIRLLESGLIDPARHDIHSQQQHYFGPLSTGAGTHDEAASSPDYWLASNLARNHNGISQENEPAASQTGPTERTNIMAHPPSSSQTKDPTRGTLAENLRDVSLAAVAEPYLGSLSGLTFAKLTQAVLRRLSPDGCDFVFSPDMAIDVNRAVPIEGATDLHLDFMNNIYFDYDQALDFTFLAGEEQFSAFETAVPRDSIVLPDYREGMRLADFYFDHSHTLYPIIHKQEVLSDIHAVLLDPEHEIAQSPPCMFRVWMVLAIGSTAHSSITLAEESLSRLYYEKAMTHSEACMDHGDIVSAVTIDREAAQH